MVGLYSHFVGVSFMVMGVFSRFMVFVVGVALEEMITGRFTKDQFPAGSVVNNGFGAWMVDS